jgi:hypothetical protein
MIGGYMLDEVDLVSCDGSGDEYDVLVGIAFTSGLEQDLVSLGIKNGRLRQIR